MTTREIRIQRAMDAAREVFCERGYDAASTAEIASRAGIAEGTIYKYFQNKRDLLIKVIEHWYHETMGDILDQISGISGTKNKLYFIIWSHLNAQTKSPDLSRLSYTEIRHSHDYYQSSVYELNKQYTHVLVEICRQGIERHELKEDMQINVLRDLIFGGIDHMMSGFLFTGKAFNIDEAAKNILDTVYNGIANYPTGTTKAEQLVNRLGELVERMEKNTP